MQSETSYQPEDVRRYYDANTKAFIRYGEGATAIHRAVWGPGVTEKAEAFRYLDRQVLRQLPPAEPGRTPRILDLGCGVGASLVWVASEAQAEAVGVTISPVQAGLANQAIAALGLAGRVRCIEASFTALPQGLGTFDLAFSIEAFLHSPDPSAYLREAARHVRPGGRLVIIDDFLTEKGAQTRGGRTGRWLDEFRYGWLTSSLVTVPRLVSLARDVGFELTSDEDLTPYLELRRPRDLAISALVVVGRHLPIPGERWRAWVGGNGLQLALTHGLLNYRVVTFQRRGEAS